MPPRNTRGLNSNGSETSHYTDFRDSMFSSDEVRVLYQDLYGEPIPLTTVATYLSRLSDRGLVRRSFSSGRWHYCLADTVPNVSIQ